MLRRRRALSAPVERYAKLLVEYFSPTQTGRTLIRRSLPIRAGSRSETQQPTAHPRGQRGETLFAFRGKSSPCTTMRRSTAAVIHFSAPRDHTARESCGMERKAISTIKISNATSNKVAAGLSLSYQFQHLLRAALTWSALIISTGKLHLRLSKIRPR